MYQRRKFLDQLHGMHLEWTKKDRTIELAKLTDHYLNKKTEIRYGRNEGIGS
jgi:hypothetical protein